jgi:hypothetical protein
MKIAIVCVVCAIGAFAVMHLHLSGQLGGGDDEPEVEVKPPEKEKPVRHKFPDALAPAARGEPVPQAADFDKSSETHPAVVLDRDGRLHDWYKRLQPGWQSDAVEDTELIIVVGTQRKTMLQLITYPNGAPPVRRYRYDMDAWLVEAKTGKELGKKRFTTIARPIRPVENWDLTELGDPVEWASVSEWVREQATDLAIKLNRAEQEEKAAAQAAP